MKNSFLKIVSLIFLLAFIASCDKKVNKIYLENSTPPVLTASSTAPMVLNINNKANNAITFSWTNPNYTFTTGLSSQDVSYTLQFDTTGANFTSPKLQEMSISKDLSTTLTVSSLNTILAKLGLAENMPHNVEIRLKANLLNGAAPLYSNVLKIVITPYLDVVYPVPANLYITGSATPASWQCGCGEPELLSQKFTKINSTTFKLTVQLSANNSYLFIPVYGDWTNKYGGTGSSNNSNNVYGDAFKPGGSDLKAPPVTKSYTITVDFKTGTFTVQ